MSISEEEKKEKLKEQVKELRTYPGVKSVKRDKFVVKVTYEDYEVATLDDGGDTYTYDEFTIRINFKKPFKAYDLECIEVINPPQEEYHEWHGYYCDEGSPMPAVGVSHTPEKAIRNAVENVELIGVLMLLKAIFTGEKTIDIYDDDVDLNDNSIIARSYE